MLIFPIRTRQVSRAAILTVIALLALLSGTAANSQVPDVFVNSLLQQKLFLLHVGEQAQTKVKKDKLRGLAGKCDVAVQIDKATWDRGTVRLEFTIIGLPSLGMKMTSQCRSAVARRLEISGFARDERPDSLAASISEILQTSEQYLATQGISLNLPAGPEDEAVIRPGPAVTPAKALLSVNPEFSEEARRAKHQGVVVLEVVIGADGRVHKPRVLRTAGMGLDEMALNTLSLWRFSPARQGDKPVACQTTVEQSFNIY